MRKNKKTDNKKRRVKNQMNDGKERTYVKLFELSTVTSCSRIENCFI